MASFTRTIIVLATLRQDLGTAQTPSTQVLIGLTLFLSFFVMTQVLDQAINSAVKPYVEEEITIMEAAQQVSVPLRGGSCFPKQELMISIYLLNFPVKKILVP